MNRRNLLLKLSALGGLLIAPCIAGAGNTSAIDHKKRASRGSRTEYAPIPLGYIQIAKIEGIPPIVLYGVALQESAKMFGQHALPYPWTLNVAGAPRRFSTYEAAVADLRANVARGITSVDCGLMQVNWRYHSDKLGSYHRALDPYPNLQAGARLLRGHFIDTGDWFSAVGRYHTQGNQQRAKTYAAQVFQRIAKVPNA